MKLKSNSTKAQFTKSQAILIFLVIIFFVFSTGYQNYKLSHLKKYGIIETAIVDSYSLQEWKTAGKGGSVSYHYKAIIEYYLAGDNEIQICSFCFKPTETYYQNKKFEIIRDSKNGFRLPVNELDSFKKNIYSKLFIPIGLILIIFLTKVFV